MQSGKPGQPQGGSVPADAARYRQPIARGILQSTPVIPGTQVGSSYSLRDNSTQSAYTPSGPYIVPRTLMDPRATTVVSSGSYTSTPSLADAGAASNYVATSTGSSVGYAYPFSVSQAQAEVRGTTGVPALPSAIPRASESYRGVQSPVEQSPAAQQAAYSTYQSLAMGKNQETSGQQSITPQGFRFTYITIRFGSATIRLKIWYWSWAKTDARLLKLGINADTMLSLDDGKSIDAYSQRRKEFFTHGRVFAVPWSQQTSPEVNDHIDSRSWIPVSRQSRNGPIQECIFIVLLDSNDEFCTALPVTIDTRVTPLPGQRLDSGFIYTGPANQAPMQASNPLLQYVRIELDDPSEHLQSGSWIDYSAVCSVMDDLPVRPIGMVSDSSRSAFNAQFRNAWSGKSMAADTRTRSQKSRTIQDATQRPDHTSGVKNARRQSPPREGRSRRSDDFARARGQEQRGRDSPSPGALAAGLERMRITRPEVIASSHGATRGCSDVWTGVVSTDAIRQHLGNLRKYAQEQNLQMFNWPDEDLIRRLAENSQFRQTYFDRINTIWQTGRKG